MLYRLQRKAYKCQGAPLLLSVGAGSAGAVVANRLSEDQEVSVLLIEAGGSELENDNFRVPIYASSVQRTKADWEYFTAPQKNAQLGMNEQVLILTVLYI